MKRTILNLLAVLFLAIVLPGVTSCSDDNNNPAPEAPKQSLSVMQKDWKFSGDADQYTIAIFANVDWKIEKNGDFLKLDKTSGSGNGIFVVSVDQNTTGEVLNGTITVKAVDSDTLIQSIKISQEIRENVLNITSEDSIAIPAEGKVLVIDVEANVDYSFEMSEWVEVVAAPSNRLMAYAMTKSKITLAVAPNEGFKARETTLVIKTGENVKKTVKITQEGKAVLPDVMTVSLTDGKAVDSVEISALGTKALEFIIKANVKYDVALDEWVTWVPKPAAYEEAEEHTMTMCVAPNLNMDRKSILRFTWKEGEIPKNKEIKLYQRAVKFEMTQNESIPSVGGGCKITVTASALGVTEADIKKAITGFVKPVGADFEIQNTLSGAIEFGKAYDVTTSVPNYNKFESSMEILATFYADEQKEVMSKSFYVMQAEAESIYLTKLGEEAKIDTIHVDAAGSDDLAFSVKLPVINPTTDDYTVSIDRMDASLAVASKTGTELHLTCKPNTRSTPYSTYVDVAFTKSTGNSTRVYIIQAAPAYTLPVRDIEVDADVVAVDWDVYFTPVTGHCVATVEDAGTMNLKITEQKLAGEGRYSIMASCEGNTTADKRTAIIKVDLYDREGGTLLGSESATVTQKGKSAVTQITASFRNENNKVIKENTGQPCQIECSGSTTGYKLVLGSNGETPSWVILGGTGPYAIWHNGRGPQGGQAITLYLMAADDEFSSANLASYAKLDLIFQ